MRTRRLSPLAVFPALAALVLGACSTNDSGNVVVPTPPPPTGTTATVAGVAGKGLLLNAIVNFYAVTNGVASTTSLETVRTSATTGAFSQSITATGPVVVTLTVDSSSQMLDELSGVAGPAPSGLVLHAALDSLTSSEPPIAVTPLTEMVYDIASAASGGLTAANIDAAETAVDTAFLGGSPAINTQPIDLKNYKTATVAQQGLAKLLVALAVAANQGTAAGASGTCTVAAYPTYSARLVCMVGGLAKLLTVDSSGKGTLTAAANYIGAAYTAIDTGTVTVEGGQATSVLGLNVVTQDETMYQTAVSSGSTNLSGYNVGVAPLTNTKDFFADVRTNILAAGTTTTFGLAPIAAAVGADVRTNVEPALDHTVLAVSAMEIASQLITVGETGISAGSSADLDAPAALVLAGSTLYVADGVDDTIVQVNSSGVISPFAGSVRVVGATNATGAAARFDAPSGVAVDTAGNVYVADYNNNSIRMITPAGAVTTIAGGGNGPTTGEFPFGMGFRDGSGATALFSGPAAIVFDETSGNLYVADTFNSAIRMISLPDYTVSTVAGGGGTGSYGMNTNGTPGFQDGSGGTNGTALFAYPFGVAVDSSGNIYVADAENHAIRKIAASGYAVSTIAGGGGVNNNPMPYVFGTPGYANGAAATALFNTPSSLAVDGSGDIFVADTDNDVIREISGGSVSLFAGTAPTGTPPVATAGNMDGAPGVATFAAPGGVIVDGSGNLYVADTGNGEIRKVDSSGNVTTFALSNHRVRSEKHSVTCAYDPQVLGTATNVALCRYGGYANPMLMTITQTSAGNYGVQTQPLTGTPTAAEGSPVDVLLGLTPSATFKPLNATFTVVPGATGSGTGTVSGPYYVTAAGGQITADLKLAASNLTAATGSGTVSASGTLSGGAGGISLTNATLGTDTTFTLQNAFGLLGGQLIPTTPHSITGTLDLTNVTTSAYSYAAKFAIGTPVLDKSGTYGFPSTVTLTGSVAEVGTGGVQTPLFNGDISLSLMGIASYDVTKPISSTNFVTADLQVAGDFSLSGGRVLNVTASLGGSQAVPTAAAPDSLTVTYTYSTPAGTAEVNATAQYDSVDGYTGTLTNNGGVKVTVKEPINGSLSGTVTDNGTTTATITTGTGGPTIDYTDGSTESLF